MGLSRPALRRPQWQTTYLCILTIHLDDERVEQAIPTITLHGVVDKIVTSKHPSQPEKAQIVIREAEDLYKEIRIDNALENGDGETVTLKHGTEVDVIIEAPVDGVDKRTDRGEKKSA